MTKFQRFLICDCNKLELTKDCKASRVCGCVSACMCVCLCVCVPVHVRVFRTVYVPELQCSNMYPTSPLASIPSHPCFKLRRDCSLCRMARWWQRLDDGSFLELRNVVSSSLIIQDNIQQSDDFFPCYQYLLPAVHLDWGKRGISF